MISGRFSIFRVLVLFAVGVFFLLGSGGGGGGPSMNNNPNQLTSEKRKEYDDLKQKRDYAQNARKRQYEEYWEKRNKEVGEYKSRLEKKAFDAGVNTGEYNEYNRVFVPVREPHKTVVGAIFGIEDRKTSIQDVPVKQGPGAHELHNKITKIDKNIKQINKQMDDLLVENRHTCFPPDTLVLMEDYSHKAIKDINIGDKVVVYDIAKDAMKMSVVKDVSISKNNHFYQINGAIKATAHERFYTQDGWKKIRELRIGDTVFDGNGFEEITDIKKEEISSTVYNLTIDESHNFFVSRDGKSSVLVHNSSGGHGGGSSGGSGGGK